MTAAKSESVDRAAVRTVTIAVLTYRRPEDLCAALPLLIAQLATVTWQGEVLVVDNDPAGSARAAVQALRDPRIRYVHEATPGIAAARNRALDECRGRDVLVFIDDDERPATRWLSALLDTYERLRPTAVVGPVTSEFSREPDPWIVAGGFFQRRIMPTGTEADVAATNNLLLDVRAVRELELRFDLRYGLTGGSDTLFTRQLVARGGQLIWCAEANVIDIVPPERLTREWVLRRTYRMGNGTALVERDLADSAAASVAAFIRLVGSGLLRVFAGCARMLVGALSGSLRQRASGARNLARGAGLVTGAIGVTYAEYARREANQDNQ